MVTLRFERDDGLAFLRGLSPFSDCTSYELQAGPLSDDVDRKGRRGSADRRGKTWIGNFRDRERFAKLSVWRNGRLLDHLLAGSFFGELSLLDGKCRSATVRAQSSDFHLLAIYATKINTLNSSIPSIARQIYRQSFGQGFGFEEPTRSLTQKFHFAIRRIQQSP